MFMVLSSWHSHCENSPCSFNECRLSARWPPTLRPNQLIWVVSPPKDWMLPSADTITICYYYSAHKLVLILPSHWENACMLPVSFVYRRVETRQVCRTALITWLVVGLRSCRGLQTPSRMVGGRRESKWWKGSLRWWTMSGMSQRTVTSWHWTTYDTATPSTPYPPLSCCVSSSSSRNEYYLGGIIALLLQDHHTMSTKSVCSSQYTVTDQHWATGAQIKHNTLSDHIREWRLEQNGLQFSAEDGKRKRVPNVLW